MSAHVQIRFLGGNVGENITGSCSMLIIKERKKTTRILIDAGLIQGCFQNSITANLEILKRIKPSEIDYIILTHSHIDHIGRVPLMIKYGFKGKIICTSGTSDLLQVMLEDTAKIQMSEAGFLNKHAQKTTLHHSHNHNQHRSRGNYDRIKRKEKAGRSKIKPLYTLDDVAAVKARIKNGGYPYKTWIRLSLGTAVSFYSSGHVMGGSVVVFRINNENTSRYICFSGDLGREDGIILPPPEKIDENIDALVIESTYGGRLHPNRQEEISTILQLLRKAYRNKQKVIIPSFALERSQEIIYLLSYYMKIGMIPPIPIYLDSPLAEKITDAFKRAWTDGMFADQDKLKFNPFSCQENQYFNIVSSPKESDKLVSMTGCFIVIAGSGMCDAGRIRGHLRHNLRDPKTIVWLIGYMAENSLGRKLKERHYAVRMNKEEIIVKAQVVCFDSFSAHADGKFLAVYANSLLSKPSKNRKKVFLVHGSLGSASDMMEDLKTALPDHIQANISIFIPKINEVHDIF